MILVNIKFHNSFDIANQFGIISSSYLYINFHNNPSTKITFLTNTKFNSSHLTLEIYL